MDYVVEIKTREQELQHSVLKPKVTSADGKITIPTQDGFEVIEISNILYCKADDNYTQLFLVDGHKKLVSKTLKYFEILLSENGFVRIHKSYLVNVNYVTTYKKGKGGTVVLNNGKELSVSPSKKAILLSFFQ